jgi:hypothetical protein
MRGLIDKIKEHIAEDKSNDNIKIRNISTQETFSIDVLKERYEEGQFDYLYSSTGTDFKSPGISTKEKD